MKIPPRRPVSIAAVGLFLVGVATRWLLGATETLRHPTATEYDDLLVALATWTLLGCSAWAVVIAAAALVETVSAGRLPATAWVGCPPSLRRLLLTGLGVALAGAGTIQPAATASGQAPLPVPARPVGSAKTDTGPTHDRSALVVHRGDNLWRIAENRLLPSAPAGEVAALVHDLHHRNRRVIGPDPDLIRPGQRLAMPRNTSRLNHTSTEETR